MKKLILISALLFSFNGFTEPSSSTNNLFWNKSVPFMTFALAMCELKGEMEESIIDIAWEEIEFGGCLYNWNRDKIIIFFTKNKPDTEDNQKPSDLCDDSIDRDFYGAWNAKSFRQPEYNFLMNIYLENFFEDGIHELNRDEKVHKWLSDHLEVYTFIGFTSLHPEAEEGVSCMYRMHRDSYVTYRIETYQSFLKNIDGS